MTAYYQKNDISLNDALALLLGHSLWVFRREEFDVFDELERNLADFALALEDARTSGDEEAIQLCTAAAKEANEEIDRAEELYTKLCGEIAKIRNDQPSVIVMVEDDPDGRGYDLVLISRQSLLDWADSVEIKVGAAHPLPVRTHTTPLLDLLDELVREFWEDYEGRPLPRKYDIEAHVKKRYGDWTKKTAKGQSECDIPDLSSKVLDSMITMMRPPALRNQR